MASMRNRCDGRPRADPCGCAAIDPTLNRGVSMTTVLRLTCTLALVVLLATVTTAQSPKPVSPPPAPDTPKGTTGTNGTPAADTSADYRLVPGDKLRIEVYKDAQ